MISVSEQKLELIYWHKFPEWYTSEVVDGEVVYKLKPGAPERIQKSFEAWGKQKDE